MKLASLALVASGIISFANCVTIRSLNTEFPIEAEEERLSLSQTASMAGVRARVRVN